MIISTKIFETLAEARAFGTLIAEGAGFKLKGCMAVSREDGTIGFSPKWEY